MTYTKEKIKKTKENNDLVEFTKYGLHYATRKWEELETFELKKIDLDEQEIMLENILSDFLESENSTSTVKKIQEAMLENWTVRRMDGGCGYEAFYFKTKKEAMDFIKSY